MRLDEDDVTWVSDDEVQLMVSVVNAWFREDIIPARHWPDELPLVDAVVRIAELFDEPVGTITDIFEKCHVY